uniref:Uncharacterized protein n=1 Tax=Meloidogyne enterolobii TaxID=390850 RepID=A0A6V7V0K5_MELEN|nr:unnamed protein product [Meloidogyne enterolobii]
MVVLVSKQLRLFPHRFNGDASSFQRLDFLIVTQWWVSLLMVDLQFRIGVLKRGKGIDGCKEDKRFFQLIFQFTLL